MQASEARRWEGAAKRAGKSKPPALKLRNGVVVRRGGRAAQARTQGETNDTSCQRLPTNACCGVLAVAPRIASTKNGWPNKSAVQVVSATRDDFKNERGGEVDRTLHSRQIALGWS